MNEKKESKYPISLVQKFLNEDRSWREIDRKFGVSNGTVKSYLKRNGFRIVNIPGKRVIV